MSINLPDRPGRYGFGPDMPIGHLNVQQIHGSSDFTVTRVVNGVTWAPLNTRDNPAWLTWPNDIEAMAWVHKASPVEDWPHWGAALA